MKPILITDLFPELLNELLELLNSLLPDEWEHPTICEGWSVKDIALHLLGGDIGYLSRKRDGHSLPMTGDDLVAFVNEINEVWIKAARRISTRLLCDLLRFTGQQFNDHLRTLAPFALGEPVSWAGPHPAPVWMDLAREYTERWVHQAQIRDALSRPSLTKRKFFAPVLETFVRALPYTYRHVDAPENTRIILRIDGAAGGEWTLVREYQQWLLVEQTDLEPTAVVTMNQDTAWRLFTVGINRSEAEQQTIFEGDFDLGQHVLDMVSIIA